MNALLRLASRRTPEALLRLAEARTEGALLERAARCDPAGLAQLAESRTLERLLCHDEAPDADDDEDLPPRPQQTPERPRRVPVAISRLTRGLRPPRRPSEETRQGAGSARTGRDRSRESCCPACASADPMLVQRGDWPWEPAPEVARTTSSVSSARFAVNNPQLFRMEEDSDDKYGSYGTILDDLFSLGAGASRQTGRLNLFADTLLPNGFPVLLNDFGWISKPLVEEKVLYDVTNSAALSAGGYLEQVVRHLAGAGQDLKILLTFLTLGGGRETSGASWDVYDNALAFDWAVVGDEHAGHQVLDDFRTMRHFDRASDSSDWDDATLDPASGYKRVFYRILARCVARRLETLRSRLAVNGIALEDYLLGVEIGNELENRHTREDEDGTIWGDAEAWGDVWFDCATAMRDEADWLPLWLPGLASAERPDDETLYRYNAWEGKRDFLDAMISRILTRLASSTYSETTSLSELIAGLDVHYYHRGSGAGRRLGYLFAEHVEVRGILDGFGLSAAALTMFETGVGVTCEDPGADPTKYESFDDRCECADAAASFAYDAFQDPVYDPSDDAEGHGGNAPADRPGLATCEGVEHVERYGGDPEVGALGFQGQSVWLRLAVALAAGADIVGWHTHIADNGDKGDAVSFAAMGLRRDQHSDAEDASVAHQRVAWFAFQKMTEVLGKVSAVSLLYPDQDRIGDGHDEFVINEGSTWTETDDVWVLEFQVSGGPLCWAYLLFIDPFGDLVCAEVTLQVASSGGRLPVTVQRQSTAPSSVTFGTAATGDLPMDAWTADDVEVETVSREERSTWSQTVGLARGVWPVLIRSNARLHVREPEVEGA